MRVKSLLRIKTLHDSAGRIGNAGLEQRVQEQVEQLQRLRSSSDSSRRIWPSGSWPATWMIRSQESSARGHRRIRRPARIHRFRRDLGARGGHGLLREYHAELGRLIQAHGGTLEQFTGGSMLIIFNDPVTVPNPAVRAVRMALEMRDASTS